VLGLGAGFLCRNLSPVPVLHLLIPAGGIAFGYILPGFGLGRMIARRRERVRLGLADALDLLVVCCEAGCGLDQAILNVSREFTTVHRALSEEFALINMEVLAGSSRSAALRNFATRTGEEEVRKLAAILIQTDRFGTSIADALRTQADYMRIRRRQVAEEKAGKVGVKLVFPIFFFCMPALVILVAGPGMIEIMKSFLGPGHGLN
jgi:tight adherence protein C